MTKEKDDLTGEELGKKLLHAVREMKAGYAARTTEEIGRASCRERVSTSV